MKIIDRLQFAWARRQQDRHIRRFGWAGAYIGNYGEAPAWAYTIGFDETLNHPEIVVFDVPKPHANRLFWRVFDEVRSDDLTIEDGLAWPPEEEEGRYAWRKVHPDQVNAWLTLACMRRYAVTGQHRGIEAYQFVLSDREGVLPWEPGYDERLRPLQPALYEPPTAKAGA